MTSMGRLWCVRLIPTDASVSEFLFHRPTKRAALPWRMQLASLQMYLAGNGLMTM
jgi:hypothetical protein